MQEYPSYGLWPAVLLVLKHRPQEGLFGLREWEDEGFIPEPAIALPSPSSAPVAPMLGCSNRLRSSSARVRLSMPRVGLLSSTAVIALSRPKYSLCGWHRS